MKQIIIKTNYKKKNSSNFLSYCNTFKTKLCNIPNLM